MHLRIFISVVSMMFALPANASAILRIVPEVEVSVSVESLLEEQRRILETISAKNNNSTQTLVVATVNMEPEACAADVLSKQVFAPKKYGNIIRRAAERYAESGITPEMLMAVVEVESSWNHEVCSAAGACGLMQLMPETAVELGVKDVHNPEQNIMGGAKYLAKLMRMFNGDVRKALAAYNAGHYRVSRAISRALSQEDDFIRYLPEETRLYLIKVVNKLSI
jgi:soluble lytic murein transglycosylase-like protein